MTSYQRVTLSQRINHLVGGHLDDERAEVWREGITMSLYISLSLLAVISAFPDDPSESEFSLTWAIFFSSVGLIMAHQVAFRMSSRLVTKGSELHANANEIMVAQLVGGAVVTAIALIPAIILRNGAYFVSLSALFAYVAIVGYLIARSKPSSRIKSLGYVVTIALAVLAILFVKGLVGH